MQRCRRVSQCLAVDGQDGLMSATLDDLLVALQSITGQLDQLIRLSQPVVESPPRSILSQFRTVPYHLSTPGTAWYQAIGANPDRVALLLTSTVGNQISYWLGPPLPTNVGFQLPTNNQPALIRFSDVGGVVCLPLYIKGSSVNLSFDVLEISYLPE